ncbi:MarR family winged helix-turn-helix transcriptional regulator [Rhizobium sp. Rhizsp82]|uniref:MarR family winged helix-turn-helix transcriptional regulator n=1 Tax=Rhizobium sp. Rhizsp82 TaxID=3243057 RepID=UPI0039B46C6B
MSEKKPKIPARGICNATAIRMASRKISHLYDTVLAPTGLKSTQFSLLAELGRRQSDPPTMLELAQAMTMDRSTLGQNMLLLERDGYVLQERDRHDGRRRRLHLTTSGRDVLIKGLPLWEDSQKRFEELIGVANTEKLREILMSIVNGDEMLRADQA